MYVNPYVMRTERIFPRQGRVGFYRYDMNENPDTLPDEFVNQVLEEITPAFLAMYPETDLFTQAFAESVGVEPKHVLPTNGSDRAIRSILEIFADPSKEVVTVSPSFEMYRINCLILGLKHRAVSYEDNLKFDFDKLMSTIDEKTGVVVLLNPNNPIGDAFSTEEVETLVQKAARVGALVIIDEAYHHFYEKSFIQLTQKYDNVVLLRTFSKIYALAACRLGVVVANENIIDHLHKARLTFDVNSIALLFGLRLLQNPSILDNLKASAKEGMTFVEQKLSEEGYDFKRSHANFLLIRTKTDAIELTHRLEANHSVLIHAYKNPLLRGFIRVSVGSPKTMLPFLNAFFAEDVAR